MGGKNQSVTHFLTMITWMDLLLVHWTCFVRGGCQWLGVFGGFFLKLIGWSGRNVHRWFWRMQQAMKVRPSPLGALFHAAAFGISTGPQGLSTWRIARWHSHTSLKHAAAPASLSLWHSLSFSSSVSPSVSLYLCTVKPFQIFSTDLVHKPDWKRVLWAPRAGNTCRGVDEQGQKAGHEAVYEPRFRTRVTSDPGAPINTSVLSTVKLYKVPRTAAISQLFQLFGESCTRLSGPCVRKAFKERASAY